jgi:DNA-binding MarR family transcriptional regulator
LSRDSKGVTIGRILAALRSADANMDRIEEAAAARLGVHRTDFRCLDVLSRGEGLTAGQLASATGLSTGAVTALLDRLERSGYVRRTRDVTDRRRVVVQITKAAVDQVWPIFQELIASSRAVLERFRSEDLKTILRFAELHDELIEQQARRLGAEQRDRA